MDYRVYMQKNGDMEHVPVDSPEEGMKIVLANRGGCVALGIEERDPDTDNDWEEWYNEQGYDCGSLTLVDGKIEVE